MPCVSFHTVDIPQSAFIGIATCQSSQIPFESHREDNSIHMAGCK